MTQIVEIQLRFALTSAFAVGSGAGRARWLDTAIARDARGDPYIPATSLKGAMRQAGRHILRALATDGGPRHCLDDRDDVDRGGPCRGAALGQPYCPLCVCFGSPRTQARFRSRDARLGPVFQARTAAEARDPFRWGAPRTRVSLDRRLGRAAQDLLFTHEVAADGLVFFADVTGYGPFRDPTAAGAASPVPPEVTFFLACALAVERLGAGTGHGGGVSRVTITHLALDGVPYPTAPAALLSEEAFETVLGELWDELPGGWR